MTVTLRQLRYFVEVADQRSFTRAAQQLGLSQPSLSQQLQGLERELGVTLLERLPREVALTTAGEAFLTEARVAVLSAARAAREARATAELEAGDLEILAIMSMAVGVLPESVRRWHRRHPGVAIRLREYIHGAALERDLRSGHGDLAIGPLIAGWSGAMESLGWEEFLVVASPTDPLAAHARVPIRELARREWVLFEATNALSRVVEQVSAIAGGGLPHGAVRTSQVTAAANLAAAGLGLALIPGTVIPPGLDATIRPVDPPIAREIGAHARTAWSPAAGAYVRLLRELEWQRARPRRAVIV